MSEPYTLQRYRRYTGRHSGLGASKLLPRTYITAREPRYKAETPAEPTFLPSCHFRLALVQERHHHIPHRDSPTGQPPTAVRVGNGREPPTTIEAQKQQHPPCVHFESKDPRARPRVGEVAKPQPTSPKDMRPKQERKRQQQW